MFNSEQILRKVTKQNNSHLADKKLTSFLIQLMSLR